MLSFCGASIVIFSETHAGWWHDEAVRFLIAAFMNENLDAQVHTQRSLNPRCGCKAEEH